MSNEQSKFFTDVKSIVNKLRDIPVLALEQLKTENTNRRLIITLVSEALHICDMAGIDFSSELIKYEAEPKIIKKGKEVSINPKLKELMKDDSAVTLEQLKNSGHRLTFSKDGPIVVLDNEPN